MLAQLPKAKFRLNLPFSLAECQTKIRDFEQSSRAENVRKPVELKFRSRGNTIYFKGHWLHAMGSNSSFPYKIYGEINSNADHTILTAHLCLPGEVIFSGIFFYFLLACLIDTFNRRESLLLDFTIASTVFLTILLYVVWNLRVLKLRRYFRNIFAGD